jgi:hypothetical protein
LPKIQFWREYVQGEEGKEKDEKDGKNTGSPIEKRMIFFEGRGGFVFHGKGL